MVTVHNSKAYISFGQLTSKYSHLENIKEIDNTSKRTVNRLIQNCTLIIVPLPLVVNRLWTIRKIHVNTLNLNESHIYE